jgi:hypothetical protein
VNDQKLEISYKLNLNDHLAWYDYFVTTPHGMRFQSSLPFFSKFKRWKYARLVNSFSNHAFGERTLEVTEQDAREFSSLFSFKTAWVDTSFAAITSKHLFIAHSSMNAHIIPLSFFEAHLKREAFLAFVKNHVRSYVQSI